MVRCCSTTSPPPISKDAAANWRSMGYSRDHRGDRPQIVVGLMCTAEGCPVAVEVFKPAPGAGRGQYRRSADIVVADRQAEAALSPAARGDGGRSRSADQRAHRADVAPVGLQPTDLIRG